MTNDYSRSLALLCPTCAGSEFEFDESLDQEFQIYTCSGCSGSFGHQQLMDANASRIDSEVDAIGEELMGEALKRLKRSFAGNKFLTIK